MKLLSLFVDVSVVHVAAGVREEERVGVGEVVKFIRVAQDCTIRSHDEGVLFVHKLFSAVVISMSRLPTPEQLYATCPSPVHVNVKMTLPVKLTIETRTDVKSVVEFKYEEIQNEHFHNPTPCSCFNQYN